MYGLVPPLTDAVQDTVCPTSNSPEQFNVILTDAVSETVNSVYSSTFTIDPALTTPTTPTPTNPIAISGNLVANMLFTGVSSTSNSFAWTIPSNLSG